MPQRKDPINVRDESKTKSESRERPPVGSDPAEVEAVAEVEVEETFLRTVDEGRRRLSRRLAPLFATGLVGGIDVGSGVLSLLLVEYYTKSKILGGLAFSVGFIALALARSELFTEDFLTHGLRFLKDFRPEAQAPGWSIEFDQWAKEAIDRRDLDALMKFENAPGMPYAHPTTEHFAPLFVTLGASLNPERSIDSVIDGFFMGLAKRSIQVA